MNRILAAVSVLGALLTGAARLEAAPINLAAYLSTGPNVVDFSDVAGAAFPGVNYDGVLVSGGARFAERFVGQTLGVLGANDTLSSSASGPLTLQTGLAGQNLAVGTDLGTNGLYPYGPVGFPGPDGYGEGSFAILFPGPVSTFGFESFFGDAASATTLDFFRADGSLIATVAVVGVGSFGFARDLGIQDIAGVSVWTADPGGLSYDNFRYGPVVADTAVPEPGTLLLLGAGLGVVAARRRLAKRP